MNFFKYPNHRHEYINNDTPYAKFDDTTTANTTYLCWEDTAEDTHIRRVNNTSDGYAFGAWDDRASLTYVAFKDYQAS